MLIGHGEIAPYLLDRKLVSRESILNGDLTVHDISRRNHNFRVISRDGPSYLIKQGTTPEGIASVAREAAFHRLLGRTAGSALVRAYIPALADYDASTGVLVLMLIADAGDLRHYHARTGRFSVTLARELGTALARLHGTSYAAGRARGAREFALGPPWILSVHRPAVEDLVTRSPASLEVVKLVQRVPDLGAHFDELSASWTPSMLSHGDLKWENCLAYPRQGSRRHDRLAIVDWETAGLGDPCWDIGSAFSAYLTFWVLSMPLTADAPLSQLPEMARYPLSAMHPALRSFWRAYAKIRGLAGFAAADCIFRSVRFAAARLVQTAFEQMQMRTELTGNVVAMVQLAQNIADRPMEAAYGLLGLGATEPLDAR